MAFFPTPDCPDLWQYLKRSHDSGRPIVLYGMGNGADKIWTVCESYGITVSDVFASDGFVRGHQFHGKTVLTFADVCQKHGRENIIVLLCFGSSRPDVLELIENVAARCELYAPDVPVCGDQLFNAEFYISNKEKFDAARELFGDETSRHVFDGIVNYKLSGRIDILRATESNPADAYREILHAEGFVTTADLGAYNGDSIRELRIYAPHLTQVVAMEPDRRNFRKLTEYAARAAEDAPPLIVHTVNEGAWSRPDTLYFDASGNRNATLSTADAAAIHTLHGAQKRVTEVKVNALDELAVWWDGHTMDFVKYDVEGAEVEALEGTRGIIAKDAPALLVSLYHRSEDLFVLPHLVHELCPNYKLYLRRMAGIPAWDINLYAVSE